MRAHCTDLLANSDHEPNTVGLSELVYWSS